MNLTTQMFPMNLTTQMFPMNLTPQMPLGTLTTQIPSMDFAPVILTGNLTGSPEPQMSSQAPKSPKSPKTTRPVSMATSDVKGYKTNISCVQPDLDSLNKIYEMACEKSMNSNYYTLRSPKSCLILRDCYIPWTTQNCLCSRYREACQPLQGYLCSLCCDNPLSPKSTGTIRDCILSCNIMAPYEMPFCFPIKLCPVAATCMEDKVTKKLSEHQEEQEESAKPQDNETPTVRERKKRDKTPSESPQSEEEVPKSSPGGEEQRGSSSSSQGNAKPESESSWWCWKRVETFCHKTFDILPKVGAAITAVEKIEMFSRHIVSVFYAVLTKCVRFVRVLRRS